MANYLRDGLATKLSPDQLANFQDDDLQLLVKKRYRNLAALEAAREEDLLEAGLEIALIRILQQAGVVGAAAGPGPGSAAAAGAAAAGGRRGGSSGGAEEPNRSKPRVNERATAMMKQLFAIRKQLPAPGQVLDFTEATPDLPLDPEFRSRIYIRECYPDLFKLLVNPSRKKYIITGTPGIGKSYFLYYLLARLLALEEPPPYIVWEHWSAKNKRWCYTHATQEVHCGNQESFDDELQNANAWYIADGMPPANLTVPAHIVCITWPQRDTYRAMHKTAAKPLYMPRWELEELLACRTQVYDNSVPTDLAIQLFTCYGGVARYVLGLPALEAAGNPAVAADVEYHLQHLKQALHGSSVAQVRAAVNSLESGPEASNRLLHIIIKDGFERSHLEFASAWVADEFMARALQEDCKGLAALVAHTEGAFSGHAFEALMHHLLPQGGDFTVMPMDDTSLGLGDEELLNLPPSCKETFKDAADIRANAFKAGVYFKSLLSNFPVVDSLLRVGDTVHLFQMTVSSRRTVSGKALRKLYEQLGLRDQQLDLRFYCVVPDTSKQDFKVRAHARSCGTRFYVLKGGMKSRRPQQAVQPLQQLQALQL